MRRPPIVLGTALITVLALLVALGLILFSVNPTASDNQKEIRMAVMSQHAIICAQVQNTANSYRFRSLTPSGNVEPIRHFLTRMQAQQQTLRLARGSECKSAPGFPPVGLQVRRALRQIHEILQHFEPKLREPVSQRQTPHNSSYHRKQGSFLPSVARPPHAGIDESGVPHQLKPELAPSAPIVPQAGRRHSPPPPEELGSPVEETPVPAESQSSAGPGTNVVEAPSRSELPATPVKIEANLEAPLEGIP
jgi:hypothetical protein